MTKQQISYSREFKREAIEMVTKGNRKILDVATKLGIGYKLADTEMGAEFKSLD